MRINVEKPSFVYDKPVLFLGKEYKDSLSFVEALLDDWDIGAMALKGGFFESFSEEYILNYSSKMPLDFHNLTENAWRNDAFSNLDALFAALLYLIEPQFKELPFPDPETRKVSFLPALTCRRMLERGTIKKWFLAMETCDPLWDEPYNKDFVLLSYLVCLLRLGMLNAYLVEDVYRSYRKRLAEKISNYEEMNQLLQKIAEHLFDKNIYVYDGRTFEKPKEFMGYLKYDFGIWDHDKWKAFIKVLLEERAARLTFMDWLYNIGEHELRNSLAGWKKEHLKALEDIKMEEVDMVFSFDAYMKWGTKQEHDHIIDELEKQLKVDYGKYKMEEKIEAVEALYKAYYELTSILFGVSEKITVKWEDLAIYRQLQELKKWWEAEQKRLNDAYESDKKFLESIKERKIVESEVQLRSKNISINGSREWKSELIVLLLAAPEKET